MRRMGWIVLFTLVAALSATTAMAQAGGGDVSGVCDATPYTDETTSSLVAPRSFDFLALTPIGFMSIRGGRWMYPSWAVTASRPGVRSTAGVLRERRASVR